MFVEIITWIYFYIFCIISSLFLHIWVQAVKMFIYWKVPLNDKKGFVFDLLVVAIVMWEMHICGQTSKEQKHTKRRTNLTSIFLNYLFICLRKREKASKHKEGRGRRRSRLPTEHGACPVHPRDETRPCVKPTEPPRSPWQALIKGKRMPIS